MTEEEILKFWEENKIFEKSVEKDAPNGDYVFYDGPPFATGTPHYGHLLPSVIKDAIPRYWTMRGYRVQRQWGWDCHGLPIENIVEKELGTKRKKDIEEIGIKKFNALCREKIFTYVDVWNKFIPRFGRWADVKNPYRTMDKNFMESEWWAFKNLYDKGLIYEDYRSMHICPRCETTLAQSEVAEGYAEVKDISVIAKFELEDEPNTFVLAWTTTPWTLPGNVALAVNPDIEYVKILQDGKNYILAKDRMGIIKDEHEIKEEFNAKDLIGKKYKALFPYYGDTFKIYGADFVNTEDGTGIVHIAPAFGEDDMNLGKKYELPFIQHVRMDGKFKDEVKDFAEMDVKPKENPQATDIEILKWLDKNNKLFSKESVVHSYPFCWRCDTPLLNYATSSWFVAVEKTKDKLIEYAKSINWVPAHIKDGRWLNWLENARDWSISRQRFWANTIPVWRCEECKKDRVFGSIAELEKASGKPVEDLHRDIVDDIVLDCECGAKMRRVPDVLDTWFDSGSVPYSTLHYPFENKDEFEARLPADFIAEGQDQVSKWFYYQHALSGALFGKNAFKNVIVNGIVLAEDGKKMSKRLQNYADPMAVMEKYGADALRMYLLSSPAVRAENLNFSEKGVDEVNKKVVSKIRNVLSFYKMYTLGGETSKLEVSPPSESQNILDEWILARLNDLIRETTKAMDNYELDKAVRPIGDFVDDLSNWYIRRSRDRFKNESDDKQNAIATTRYVMLELSKLIAPFIPFVAEEIYQEVADSQPLTARQESVHLEEWPEGGDVDKKLLEEMEETRKIVRLGLESRLELGIKIRQPLSELKVKTDLGQEYLDLIKSEVNAKKISTDIKYDFQIKWNSEITEELKQEGMARELTRKIQDLRKKSGLIPQDKVDLVVETDEEGKEFVNKFANEIKKSTNLESINFSDISDGEETKIEELNFKIGLKNNQGS